MLGDLKMGENKNNKKIINTKNLAFYLGNQKFDNCVALKNKNDKKLRIHCCGLITLCKNIF